MKKVTRKRLAVALGVATLSVGLIGIGSAPAMASPPWGCTGGTYSGGTGTDWSDTYMVFGTCGLVKDRVVFYPYSSSPTSYTSSWVSDPSDAETAIPLTVQGQHTTTKNTKIYIY
ncbi:MAG TPA: hypothetical protein VHZ98_14385 [Galbitalea sp.]|nr:hypothetical protein [Galbitalea sp.]